jgi:hypothetical protein
MKTTMKTKPQLKNKMKTKLIALLALVTLPAFGSITTPISNLNQPGADFGYYVDSSASPAVSFTTGSQATYLSSITILASLALTGNNPRGDLVLSLYSNSGSAPGSSLTTLTGSNPNTPVNDFVPVTFTDSGSTLLAANTTYWIVASDPIADNEFGYVWGVTSSTSADSGSSWDLGQAVDYLNDYALWGSLSSELQFSVQVSETGSVAPVPEASTYMAGLSMAAILGLSLLRKPRSAAV